MFFNLLFNLVKISNNKSFKTNKDEIKYLITKANSNCLGECISEILRGFIIVLFKKRNKVAGIETLNVDPIYHGNGIGKKLLIAEKFSKWTVSDLFRTASFLIFCKWGWFSDRILV